MIKTSNLEHSRVIKSNQAGIHESLEKIVKKHLSSTFKKPFQQHTVEAFRLVEEQISQRPMPLILDSCCGVGDSSRYLAEQNPDHWVIGIDKSEARLSKERPEHELDNLILLRADLNDFYRLAAQAGWTLAKHCIFYPNPWPKSSRVQKRWHGSAVFPDMLKLSGEVELRSNWRLYLEEFQFALKLAGFDSQLSRLEVELPITAFERKYGQSGQLLWQLQCDLSKGV